ncbi:ROK family protein [uncultured Flavobacterium sp.]|uniref:ROK family protein n=1 Tax=uncultured Flavobacterium sp. TaxID=165435 RepID=UPI0030CA1F46
MDSIVLGIDIGGTYLKIGRVENGSIVKQTFNSVDSKAKEKETLSSLFEAIDSIINSDVTAIGIGVPAVVDPITGVVYDVQNIPSWKEVALKEIIEKRYNLPVYLNNDANCFALGEKIFGKGKKYENFIGLSIGTGIGMGIIINNNLYNGVLCGAGEVGMLPYKDGIMEEYSSSFFFSKNYQKTAEELSLSAAEGNETALQAYAEFGFHLGECIKSILYMYAPEAIIIGGSISKSFLLFKESMELSLKSFAYQKQIEGLKIETSNQEGIAILGAASLCFQDVENPVLPK